MTLSLRRGAALAILMLPLWACGSYPIPKIYVLGDPATPTPAVTSVVGATVIEMRTVTVPDYLDSTDIMRRRDDHRMVASATGQWADRLSAGVTEALAADLRRRLPNVLIEIRPTSPPARRVVVEIEGFEIAADGACTLTARWRMVGDLAKTVAVSEEGTFVERPAAVGDAAATAGMTLAIDELAGHIAATIQRGIAPA